MGPRAWDAMLARVEELQAGEPDVPAILEMLVLSVQALDYRLKLLEGRVDETEIGTWTEQPDGGGADER